MFFRLAWLGLKRFYDELGFSMGLNLLFTLVSLPVVTLPAAWAALLTQAYGLVEYEDVGYRRFWAELVRRFPRAELAGLQAVAGTALLVINILFYLRALHHRLFPLAIFCFYLLVFWAMVQLHFFTAYTVWRQSWRQAFRTALYLTFRWPGATLGLLASLLILLFLGVRIPILGMVGLVSVGALVLAYTQTGLMDPTHNFGPPPDEGWPVTEDEEEEAAGEEVAAQPAAHTPAP